MHARVVVPLASIVVLSSGALLAQDPVKAAADRYKTVLDNATVRVLRIDYPPGAKAAMHSHPDAIVIPLSAAKVQFTSPDGKSETAEMTKDTAMYTPKTTHSNVNMGAGPVDGLLVEFKKPSPGTATVPTSRDAMNIKVLAEGPHAVAYHTTADPSFQEPAGTTHEFDQVVIALDASPMSLSIDGKPAKTSWTRGEVAFIPRGVPHESKNTSGKPLGFIIVAVK